MKRAGGKLQLLASFSDIEMGNHLQSKWSAVPSAKKFVEFLHSLGRKRKSELSIFSVFDVRYASEAAIQISVADNL